MATICFKAFSFLQARLKAAGLESFNECMEIQPGQTVQEIINSLGLDRDQVEAAFVNGRVSPFSTPLKDGDRLALVPPGTPGPYRVLLGIRDGKQKQGV
jgi:molybdopterin converting factor small subunit